jgi:hypothetical protein
MDNQRLNEQIDFLKGVGAKYRSSFCGMDEPRHNFFRMLHEDLRPPGEVPTRGDAK